MIFFISRVPNLMNRCVGVKSVSDNVGFYNNFRGFKVVHGEIASLSPKVNIFNQECIPL